MIEVVGELHSQKGSIPCLLRSSAVALAAESILHQEPDQMNDSGIGKRHKAIQQDPAADTCTVEGGSQAPAGHRLSTCQTMSCG